MPRFDLAGTLGVPTGNRPDDIPDLQDDMINTLLERSGGRFAWLRQTICPCEGVTPEVRRPTPGCPLCDGQGLLYFGLPSVAQDPTLIGDLTPLQRAYVDQSGAIVIKGVFAKAKAVGTLDDTPLGRWQSAEPSITVRPENKVGFADRLVELDNELVFSETSRMPLATAASPLRVPTRYPAIDVSLVRSLETVYVIDIDYTVELGAINFIDGRQPAPETILALHYTTFPVWRVIKHPHLLRETSRLFPSAAAPTSFTQELLTPTGRPTRLPIQCEVGLEFVSRIVLAEP